MVSWGRVLGAPVAIVPSLLNVTVEDADAAAGIGVDVPVSSTLATKLSEPAAPTVKLTALATTAGVKLSLADRANVAAGVSVTRPAATPVVATVWGRATVTAGAFPIGVRLAIWRLPTAPPAP